MDRYVREHVYIGGEWVAPSGNERLHITSPVTEMPIGSAPAIGVQEADRAVEAARTAYDAGVWRSLSPGERRERLAVFADRYGELRSTIAQTITDETGATITWTTASETDRCHSMIRTLSEVAESYPWEQAYLDGAATLRKEPVGVVAAIPAWNVPQVTALAKLVPSLLAGCSVVLKPSVEVPLDGLLLADALDEAGLPPGVVNVIPGGPEVGDRLVRHPDVDQVSFTGSTATGRHIASLCGQSLKRVSLELGGKSAAIVCEDADLDMVARGLRRLSFAVNGQGCMLQTRILVPRSRFEETSDAIVEMVRSLRVGDPNDPETEIGPLVSEKHRERVRGYIRLGENEGARVAIGGVEAPEGLDRGWYIAPTVFVDVDNHMRIAREEIFGPVLALIGYEDEEEAVEIANDSSFGLCGSVWTDDTERGMRIASSIHAGVVGLNEFRFDHRLPFGGVKGSGIGREFGRDGFDNYVESKVYYHYGAQGR